MTKLGIVFAMFIGVGAGCGGSQKAGPQAPTQESRCTAATDHMGTWMAATLTAAGETAAAGKVPDMTAGMYRTCVADVWSDAALTCTTSASSDHEMGACQQHFTQAQLDAIKANIDGIMGEATGAGMQYKGGEEEDTWEGGGSRGGDPCGDGADPCGGGE
ncbi:MAG: hypothetical protein R3B06_23875 [Kofleriaceae bacterium]